MKSRSLTLPDRKSHRLVAALLLSLLSLTLGATASQAHTTLISSKPVAGELLSQRPSHIELIFGEPLERIAGKSVSQVSVVDSSGKSLNAGDLVVTETSISVPVRSPAVVGPITVNYRVAAQDGHVLESSFTFYYKSKVSSSLSSIGSTSQSNSQTQPNSTSNSGSKIKSDHSHDQSTSTQKIIYASTTALILFGGVWGIWYYRKKTRKLI